MSPTVTGQQLGGVMKIVKLVYQLPVSLCSRIDLAQAPVYIRCYVFYDKVKHLCFSRCFIFSGINLFFFFLVIQSRDAKLCVNS